MQLLLVMAALGIEYVMKINIHIRNSSDTAVFVVSLLLHIIFILSSSINHTIQTNSQIVEIEEYCFGAEKVRPI